MNTDLMQSEYESKYPRISEKFITITNGFDTEMYQLETQKRSNDGFQIVYPGKFYGNLEPVFSAFSTLFDSHPEAKFVHLGEPDPEAQQLSREFECEDNIVFRGHVDTNEVVDALYRSDLGLALGRDITHIPMKVYDYMGCNLPILAVGPQDGILLDLVNQFDGGYTVNRNNTTEIQSKMHKIYSNMPKMLAETSELEPFRAQNLTKKLSDILNESLK